MNIWHNKGLKIKDKCSNLLLEKERIE